MLVMLGIARLFVVVPPQTDLDVREIETVNFEPPPPPPPAEEEPPPDAPPPPPALTNLSELPDPTRVSMPTADVPIDITMPVEEFFVDAEPAPLPTAPVEAAPRPAKPTKPAKITTPKAPPVVKSHYNTNELDGTPSLIRHGSATFPSNLARQGVKNGTVIFEVELSTSGAVSVRKVISTTHPDLVGPARRVASGARFTPPKKGGQPVKAIMRWPITIQK
jgi:hypothetical protein